MGNGMLPELSISLRKSPRNMAGIGVKNHTIGGAVISSEKGKDAETCDQLKTQGAWASKKIQLLKLKGKVIARCDGSKQDFYVSYRH